MEKLRKIKMADGTVRKYTYKEVCDTLGISADVRFVEITNAGTISFTVGKPEEVMDLYKAIVANGFRPTHRLERMVKEL